MDARAAQLAASQDGIVTWGGLRALGMSEDVALRAVREARRLHDGVWLVGVLPPTRRQLQRAATMTAPGTVLSFASAGALHEVRPFEAAFETVTRPGSGGPRRSGALLVMRSRRLEDDVVRVGGIPVTSTGRTIIDLAAHVGDVELAKLVREALRRRLLGVADLESVAARHAGVRGAGALNAWLRSNADVPFHRCRSDAEARALEVLRAAGAPTPAVNVRIAGAEADLSWPDRRVIVEIDGPQWHRDPVADARRTASWRAAGWDVRRVASSVVFDDSAMLIAVVRA